MTNPHDERRAGRSKLIVRNGKVEVERPDEAAGMVLVPRELLRYLAAFWNGDGITKDEGYRVRAMLAALEDNEDD